MDVYRGIAHRKRQQQAGEAREQLKVWRVAAEEDVKTEKETELERGWTSSQEKHERLLHISRIFCSNQKKKKHGRSDLSVILKHHEGGICRRRRRNLFMHNVLLALWRNVHLE